MREPGSLPFPDRPAGSDCLPGIDHIVILMKENHSYDNYFGMLDRGDGFTLGPDGTPLNSNPDGHGQPGAGAPPEPAVQPVLSREPDLERLAPPVERRGDGRVRHHDQQRPIPWATSTGRTCPGITASPAPTASGTATSASVLAQTFPNRRFLQAATAAGLVSTSIPSPFAKPPATGLIWDLLDAHDIGWANYFAELPEVGLWPRNLIKYHGHLHDIGDFYDDCREGRLPPVTLLTTEALAASEGEFQDDQVGEAFTASLFEAAAAGPQWQRMLFVIIWDEGGGFYDHVPPPAAVTPDDIPPDIHVPPDEPGGYDRYGFRVPCLVASPFAKPGHVSSVVYDHTSVLATIEHKWNLPALTRRDAAANPLTDFLDLGAPPHFTEPAPAPPPVDLALHRAALARGERPPGTPAGLDAPATPSREHRPRRLAWPAGLLATLLAAGAGAALAFVHGLDPGYRDRPALLDQVRAERLRGGHLPGPRRAAGEQRRRGVHGEVGGRHAARARPRAPGTTPARPAGPAGCRRPPRSPRLPWSSRGTPCPRGLP